MTPIHNQEHSLYRFFGAGDVLLYVGLTVRLPTRLRDHQRGKAWWTEVERMTVQRYPGRPEVEEAERLAIMIERPKYNIQHNGKADTRMSKPEQSEVMFSETLVGSHFFSDAARGWQGYVVESLGDGFYFVCTYSWSDGTEYSRHIVSIGDMKDWRFYSSDEQMRYCSSNVQAIWKREKGETPPPLTEDEFVKAFEAGAEFGRTMKPADSA